MAQREQNLSFTKHFHPNCLRTPEGRDRPALMREELAVSVVSPTALLIATYLSLAKTSSNMYMEIQRGKMNSRKLYLHHRMTIPCGYSPTSITLSSRANATYFHSVCSHLAFKTDFLLQSISPLYMQRGRERADWLLHKQRCSRARSSFIYWFKSE